MALIARDPFDFSVPGVALSTLVITVSHPAPISYTAYDASLGGWQAGWNGTVVDDGAGGYDVTITTHPLLIVGVWTVTVVANSNSGLPGGGNWSFTVSSDPPVLSHQSPSGATTELDVVGFRLYSPYGVDSTTVKLEAYDAITQLADALVAIDGGAIQAGWGGTVRSWGPVYGDEYFEARLTSWPSDLEPDQPILWRFRVSATTQTGVDL